MSDWFSRRPDNAPRESRKGRRPSVSIISDELLIGEYLNHHDIEWLKNTYGVTAVLNLQDDLDFQINALDAEQLRAMYATHGIKFVRSPIQDGSADAMGERLEVALNDLRELVHEGARVYVHCNAGMNRAPTLVIAFLRAYRQMSLEEAMLTVKRQRPCGPFMTVLEEYFGPRHYKPDK
jgi:protein-tyrosine phosphatase